MLSGSLNFVILAQTKVTQEAREMAWFSKLWNQSKIFVISGAHASGVSSPSLCQGKPASKYVMQPQTKQTNPNFWNVPNLDYFEIIS